MFQSGRQVSPCAWYNLSLQSLQPLLRVRFVEAGSGRGSSSSSGGSSKTDGQPIEIGRSAGSGIASSISAVQGDISDALTFSGGSSLHLRGSLRPGQRAAVQLFEAVVQLPAAGLWVRFTARPSNGVEARLELTLAAAAGGHGSSSSASSASSASNARSIELLPVLGTSAASDSDVAPAARAPVASSRGAVELAACACSQIGCIGPASTGIEAGAAAAASGGGVVAAPDWVTWQYCLEPATLAAASQAEDSGGAGVLLAGIYLLLTGTATGKDPAAHPFQMHLGEMACLACLAWPALPRFYLTPLSTSGSWVLSYKHLEVMLVAMLLSNHTLQGSFASKRPHPAAARLSPPACSTCSAAACSW